jgi:hypothetical protein
MKRITDGMAEEAKNLRGFEHKKINYFQRLKKDLFEKDIIRHLALLILFQSSLQYQTD